MINQKLLKQLIEEYQCPGCVAGSNTNCGSFCETQDGWSQYCDNHVPGTRFYPGGRVLLGLPVGFNRLGQIDEQPFVGFSTPDQIDVNMFNVPVWKHLDSNGNTLLRLCQPRLNRMYLFIFQGDVRAEFDCQEITAEHIEEMD